MKGILAAGMAPAIVRAESLMPINSRILVPDKKLIVPQVDVVSPRGLLTIHTSDGTILASISVDDLFSESIIVGTTALCQVTADVEHTGVAGYVEIDDPSSPGRRRGIPINPQAGEGITLSNKLLGAGSIVKFENIQASLV